ncbi:MAG: DinB family protein [Candidatus Cloacimonetes bacterium]|nr:DinB family protein [Candidatus Cloacimonadota bacterium]
MSKALVSQYGAGLLMLDDALRKGQDLGLWISPAPVAPFWQIGYHALFYTDLYLCADERAFRPWPGHEPSWPRLGDLAVAARAPELASLLEYTAALRSSLTTRLSALDPDSPAGFEWIPFNRGELFIYTLRHLQHHTGQLAERVRHAGGPPVSWVGLDLESEV